MSDWKIELGPGTLAGEVLQAQQIWNRLSKPARAAIEAAYPEWEVLAHGNTMGALKRHGFVEYEHGWRLTDAGKRVAKWNVDQ